MKRIPSLVQDRALLQLTSATRFGGFYLRFAEACDKLGLNQNLKRCQHTETGMLLQETDKNPSHSTVASEAE